MAIVPYTQWLPYVQVNVPDCPKALIVEAIRQKVIEFCLRELNSQHSVILRDCGVEIPLARRQFAKGITRCVDCQEIVEIKRGKR